MGSLSCVSAFFGPAQTVTIRSAVPIHGLLAGNPPLQPVPTDSAVPIHGLLAANALMQLSFMGSRIIGPATAGAIVAAFSPRVCYTVDVARFLISASLIGSVVIRRPPATQAPPGSSSNRIHQIWIDMKQGMSFILHHAAILFFVLAMAAGLFTIGCFAPLISIWVRDT